MAQQTGMPPVPDDTVKADGLSERKAQPDQQSQLSRRQSTDTFQFPLAQIGAGPGKRSRIVSKFATAMKNRDLCSGFTF